MAGEQDDSTPEREDLSQLELPKLFRRGRKAKDAAAAPEAPPEPVADVPAVEEPAAEEPVAEQPVAPDRKRGLRRRRESAARAVDPTETEQQPSAGTTPTPETDATTGTTVVEQRPSASEGASVETPTAETATPETDATTATTVVEQRPSASEGASVETPTEAGRPSEDHADTAVVAPVETAPSAGTEAATERWEPSAREAAPTQQPPAEPEPTAPPGPSLAERLSAVRLPPLAGQVAAAVTGAVVGLVGVGLVVLSERGCEAVRGASSCGSAGLFLVLGVAALMVVLGALALAGWRQESALSTSFLGVGLLAVLVMLFLLPVIFAWFMVLVLPVLGAGTFALSWWVSNRMGPEARKVNDEYSREIHR